MAKYLMLATLTQEGSKGTVKEGGTKRAQSVAALMKSLGGKQLSFHYAFGEYDIAVVTEMPSHAATAAASLMVASSGVASVKTIELLEPAEMDEASQLASSAKYRKPGE